MTNIILFWCLKKIIIGKIIKSQAEFWQPFLSEAVEASQSYFFLNRLIKLKCPHLLNVLLPFFKLGSQLLLAILDFKVCHIELKHPVCIFILFQIVERIVENGMIKVKRKIVKKKKTEPETVKVETSTTSSTSSVFGKLN